MFVTLASPQVLINEVVGSIPAVCSLSKILNSSYNPPSLKKTSEKIPFQREAAGRASRGKKNTLSENLIQIKCDW